MQVPRMVEELCAGDVSCIPLGFCRAVTNDGDGGWVEIVFPFRAFPKLLGVQIHASSQIDRREAAQQASNDRERIYLLLQEHRLEIGIALGLSLALSIAIHLHILCILSHPIVRPYATQSSPSSLEA